MLHSVPDKGSWFVDGFRGCMRFNTLIILIRSMSPRIVVDRNDIDQLGKNFRRIMQVCYRVPLLPLMDSNMIFVIPAEETVSQWTELRVLLFCHSRAAECVAIVKTAYVTLLSFRT
jgi:hypothetical protein